MRGKEPGCLSDLLQQSGRAILSHLPPLPGLSLEIIIVFHSFHLYNILVCTLSHTSTD